MVVGVGVAAATHASHPPAATGTSAEFGCGTVVNSSFRMVRPQSASALFPSTMLTPSTYAAAAPVVMLDTQTAKGRASAVTHSMRVSGSGAGLGGDRNRLPMGSSSGVTAVSRTAQRWVGSASAAMPVSGPSTSLKISTMPGTRSGKEPLSHAEVAPAGRQHRRSPHVYRFIALCAANRGAFSISSKTWGDSFSAWLYALDGIASSGPGSLPCVRICCGAVVGCAPKTFACIASG